MPEVARAEIGSWIPVDGAAARRGCRRRQPRSWPSLDFPTDEVEDPVRQRHELRIRHRLDRPLRPRDRHGYHGLDLARPFGHHDDAITEKYRLVDIVRDEHDRVRAQGGDA